MARQHAGHRPGETAVHQRVHQQLSRRRSSLHAEIQSGRLGQGRRPHDQLHPPDPDECIRPEGPERQRQGHCGLAWESSESRLRIPRDRTVPPADGYGHPRDCDRVRAALHARSHSRRRRRCARQCLVQRQQKPVRGNAGSEDRQGDELPPAGTGEARGPRRGRGRPLHRPARYPPGDARALHRQEHWIRLQHGHLASEHHPHRPQER